MAIKQTAGRDALGEFAPKFAELNDDVLFGQVWSREDKLSLCDRSIVTVTALMAQGLVDSSFQYHLMSAKKERRNERRNRRNPHPRGVLRRLAQGMGGLPYGQGSLEGRGLTDGQPRPERPGMAPGLPFIPRHTLNGGCLPRFRENAPSDAYCLRKRPYAVRQDQSDRESRKQKNTKNARAWKDDFGMSAFVCIGLCFHEVLCLLLSYPIHASDAVRRTGRTCI